MKKRNIDLFLEDLLNDEASIKEWTEHTKAALAVLAFLYIRQAMRPGEREDMVDNLPEWMDEMQIDPSFSTDQLISELRDYGILNSANRFRKVKGLDDGIQWMLFAMVLEGLLECKFDSQKGDYFFKNTEKGETMARKIIGDL